MQLTNVLIAPVVTEKSSMAQADSKYTFKVHSGATKVDVARAVEKAYGVKVEAVNILPVLKKTRLVGRGRTITKRPMSKKAVVTLKEKQSLDFNKLQASK